MLDGRISEDSAVDLGDVITDEDEIIEELIKRGMCIPTAYLVITQKAGIYAPFVQNDKSCIGCNLVKFIQLYLVILVIRFYHKAYKEPAWALRTVDYSYMKNKIESILSLFVYCNLLTSGMFSQVQKALKWH